VLFGDGFLLLLFSARGYWKEGRCACLYCCREREGGSKNMVFGEMLSCAQIRAFPFR